MGAVVQDQHLTTMVHTGRGYTVFDPEIVAGTHYSIDDRGTLVYSRFPAGATTALVLVCAAVTAAVLGGGSWLWVAVWFVAGIPIGVVLAGFLLSLIHLVNSPERRYQARTGSAVFSLDVERDSAAGRLCELAGAIAASRAWRSATIDPDRLLGPVLWSAVLLAQGPVPENGGRDVAGELHVIEENLSELADIAAELDQEDPARLRRAGVAGSGPIGPGAGSVGPAAADYTEKILAQGRTVRDTLREI
ncbi:hypothetical protein [Pseudonocardia acidicola]|uniref:Uncharacterized protein n=1 Tax=Pseudonocardia acidicola TaxID=2724939 RepID=A0ABX1SN50_9PSEU|nr:hypothetical protein [Pseudonocardia acidicola]NMI01974.1 hypothetical protein [Pseudonocardia acidicola]